MRFIIYSLAGMAAVRGDDQVNCTLADYTKFGQMHSPDMAACIGGNEEQIGTCFANTSIVDLTGACSGNILGGIITLARNCFGWCDDYTNTSATCQNCLEFNFMMITDYMAPWEAPGACGEDWLSLGTANLTTGVDCGGETPNRGPHCLANADGVSNRCGNCIERRHARVMTSCTPACDLNQTNPACTECVLYGDMAAMAYCMVSGVPGASTLLLAVTALIAVTSFAF